MASSCALRRRNPLRSRKGHFLTVGQVVGGLLVTNSELSPYSSTWRTFGRLPQHICRETHMEVQFTSVLQFIRGLQRREESSSLLGVFAVFQEQLTNRSIGGRGHWSVKYEQNFVNRHQHAEDGMHSRCFLCW